MSMLYYGMPETISVNTPRAVGRERIKGDSSRFKKDENDDARKFFGYVFEVSGALKEECISLIVGHYTCCTVALTRCLPHATMTQ